MGFPCLVIKRFCKTPIKVFLDNVELNEDGELESASFTKDKEKIELKGVALFRGDLCESLPVIASGSVVISEQEYSINKGTKNLNPDGTVNYTTLELI